jgi:hypothetical protein
MLGLYYCKTVSPARSVTSDRWDDATGENLIEQIAAVGDYLVALATYRAAVKRWPKDKITLRNRALVLDGNRGWKPGRPTASAHHSICRSVRAKAADFTH